VKNSFRSSCLIVLESDVDIDPDDFIISPKYCGVDVILTKEKSVPVKIKLEGGADIEYGTSFKPDVSSILICGEPADVDGVESINVMIPYEKITNQLGSGKESFTVKGKLIYPDKIKPADGEATDITEIEVTVLVSKKVETVPKENVVISGCPLGYTASVSNVEIDLIGLYEELERINSSSVTVTVELSGVAPSVAEQKVKGEVYIETPFGTIYKKQCLVSVAFSKIAA
jgi:YbbR domain-containing protein